VPARPLPPRREAPGLARSHAIGPQHDVGVEHPQQGLEVTLTRGGDERLDRVDKRATTVVSQPPRLSTSRAFVRLSRSHVS
jgi:hypothetical protein